MRLLLISSEFPPGPGGIGNHAYELALNLHRLGWELAVQAPQDYASLAEAETFSSKQPFSMVRVPSGRGQLREAFHRLKVATRQARRHKPDLLLGTGLSGVWVAAALSKLRRLPMAAVAHGSEFGMNRGISGAVNRWAFQRAAVVIAVSQFTSTVVLRAGIRPRRMLVIPNAVDSSRFPVLDQPLRAACRKKAGCNGVPLLLTIGHISERKGQEIVIRALPQILQDVPAVQYLMVGLPTLKPQLARLANELGVSQHIHFLGRVGEEEKLNWLNCCDLFLMPSRTTADGDCEGFGIAVVEAALCGKPAVVSAGSGIVEAIEGGVTGLPVPEGDPAAVAQAVISLLQNPARLQAMGEAARKRALSEQTWETCAPKYDALLRKIVV